jgi:hypothetical protein
VEEDSGETGKKGFVNHKLESIEEISKTGIWIDCADEIRRNIFPLVLILSADCDKHLQSYGLWDVDVSYNLFDVILIGALKYILNRMCFGESPILIHTVHYPGIAFMW